MKVFDDAELVFDIKNVPDATNYEIVLRYEPQVSNNIILSVKEWINALPTKLNVLFWQRCLINILVYYVLQELINIKIYLLKYFNLKRISINLDLKTLNKF